MVRKGTRYEGEGAMAARKTTSGGEGAGAEINRGTQDEMEIIMLIISENLSLKQAVLEKVRQTKYRLGLHKKDGSEAAPPPGAGPGRTPKAK